MNEHAAPLRGLIAHDEVASQRALGIIMERCGFEVVEVAGIASQALPAAERLRPDAVVADLALSGDYGLDIVSEFQRVSPGCMVVLLSPFTGLRRRARELGALSLVDAYDLRHVEDWLLYGLDPEGHPCGP